MADAKKKKTDHDDRMEKDAGEAPEGTDADSEQEEEQVPRARGPWQEEKMMVNPKTGKLERTIIIYD